MNFRLQESRMRGIFSTLPELTTKRLILRRMTMRDAKDIFVYAQDPQVARHVLWDAHTSLRTTRGYVRCMIRQYRAGEPSSYVLVLKDTGRVIGTIGFMAVNCEDSVVEIGYSIARDCWNQGYTTEALRCLLDFAFGEMRVHRVEARYEWDNPASGRVMAKCGMKPEGTLRGAVYNKGRYADVCVCGMLREDWEQLKQV